MPKQLLEVRTTDPVYVAPANSFSDWPKLSPLALRRNQRRAVRSQEEIEASILDSCRTPTVQHWIMVKARLGYDTFWKHMNGLLSAGMMDEMTEGSRTLYQTSTKGLEVLEKLSTVEETLQGL